MLCTSLTYKTVLTLAEKYVTLVKKVFFQGLPGPFAL